ncbi:hypothetical protein A3F66_04930 [candidate division TM6 bacterium RIFCSPHIGHO2_12_FULL_32_22]|nr:MAG: hypothetical protein A3F66_04930 [candidate division TM6 bacterium RIFCSPHIGHO2_12_FULL_32_22]
MNIFKKLINYPSEKARIFDIDFKKPWVDIFWHQKSLILGILFYVIIDDATLSIFPVIVGLMIESRSYSLAILVAVIYIVIEIISWFTYHPYLSLVFSQTHDNFRYNAYKHLLIIDPVNHVQTPSGLILGKIQRTTTAFLDIADTILDELIPIVVETLTVVITMMLINFKLGLIVGFSIFSLSILFYIVSKYYTEDLENQLNKTDDQVNQIGAESLTQFQFIRASFTTDMIRKRLFKSNLEVMSLQTSVWMTYRLIRGVIIVLYWVALTAIIGYLISLINSEKISIVLATTLVMMYLRGTKGIFAIDKRIKIILKSYRRIKDFYSFINALGTQTFPVLDTDLHKVVVIENEILDIGFNNINFAYPEQLETFQDNNFRLTIGERESNKLFGIIGPSGIGKTTLISILGGQIKPDHGKVIINDIDVYSVDDSVRRKLIALQGQVATGMRGSLRYNLTFGLPEAERYSDEILIGLLESVGLWSLFENKEGLKTEIGESGLNLSGGQRQRLNFANLYLRANYYKPILILIDEPTSSLDEVSEKSITSMISELSAQSLTMVIAHRLKTLENAKKILDLSLMRKNSELKFYPPDQLREHSEYYRQLLEGTQDIEN